MISIRLKDALHWCRTHWNWVFSAALHVIILLALLLSVSSSPEQYQVSMQNSAHQQPQIVNAQMVTMAQVLPPKPKVDHQPKKVVQHKPKPKPKPIPKAQPKTVAIKKAPVKPKPKPVVKHTQTKAPAKPTVDKQALESLRSMALSGIADAAKQQKLQAATEQRWQTEKEKYLGLIQQLVRLNWNNPDPGAQLQVVLLISLNNKGEVQSVSVSQSSGNSAFDRQAVLAVQKSSPLPLPKDQQLAQQFATLRLPFSG